MPAQEEGPSFVGTITEHLGIEDEFVTSELVDVWFRQFQLAISNTVGYARATVRQENSATNIQWLLDPRLRA